LTFARSTSMRSRVHWKVLLPLGILPVAVAEVAVAAPHRPGARAVPLVLLPLRAGSPRRRFANGRVLRVMPLVTVVVFPARSGLLMNQLRPREGGAAKVGAPLAGAEVAPADWWCIRLGKSKHGRQLVKPVSGLV
jgi:hypothetical protein